MARQLRPKEDALFVEGPDDMAVVNALVKVPLGLDIGRPVELARKPLSQTGGLEAAIAGFERRVRERKAGAHVGLLIDRDGHDGRGDNMPRVEGWSRINGLAANQSAGGGRTVILPDGGRLGIWMWPDNASTGDLENLVASRVTPGSAWDFARQASAEAKAKHLAEFDLLESRKVELKVRSVWLGESGGGYGHIIGRGKANLSVPGVLGFVKWFSWLFLEE